ncbi:MAG: hypothetical protein HQL22_11800 [Candidatus Omnitrophica bacterium]|nr:hypothetical protein [Candidatus Omnitrophota bacterium]
MNLSADDKKLLDELCVESDVSSSKVLRLLETVQNYEFKERRSGIYEELREVVKAKLSEGERH